MTTAPDPNVRTRWSRFGGWVRHILRDGHIPYLDRYSVRKQGPSGTNAWRAYLHHFLAPDAEGHHNHPQAWSFSIVLWGSYTEEVLTFECAMTGPVVRTRRVRWFNWIPDGKYHRITELHPGRGGRGVWTLFVCGPLTGRGWGYWIPGRGHVPFEQRNAEIAAHTAARAAADTFAAALTAARYARIQN